MLFIDAGVEHILMCGWFRFFPADQLSHTLQDEAFLPCYMRDQILDRPILLWTWTAYHLLLAQPAPEHS